MPHDDSVSNWLSSIRAGDRAAVGNLWNRYFHRMMGLARLKLRNAQGGAADEEDVALSAFDSFCQGIELGQFPDLQNRDDLWRLLVCITVRKAINAVKLEAAQKRGGGELTHTDDEILQNLISREPSPVITAAMNEECLRLLDRLQDDSLRRLALLKLDGHDNTVCAEHLNRTRVTVQRMLKLIQQTWQQELAS